MSELMTAEEALFRHEAPIEVPFDEKLTETMLVEGPVEVFVEQIERKTEARPTFETTTDIPDILPDQPVPDADLIAYIEGSLDDTTVPIKKITFMNIKPEKTPSTIASPAQAQNRAGSIENEIQENWELAA